MPRSIWVKWGFGYDLKWIEPESFSRQRVRNWMDIRYLPSRLKIFAVTIFAVGGIHLFILPSDPGSFVWYLFFWVMLGLLVVYGSALKMWFLPVKVIFSPSYLTVPLKSCQVKALKWQDIKSARLTVQTQDERVYRVLEVKTEKFTTRAAISKVVDIDRILELLEEFEVTLESDEPLQSMEPALIETEEA